MSLEDLKNELNHKIIREGNMLKNKYIVKVSQIPTGHEREDVLKAINLNNQKYKLLLDIYSEELIKSLTKIIKDF